MRDVRPQSLGHGIHTIPAPLPFPSPRWVNVYLIERPDGLVMIDCGVDWEPGHQALMEGFASLGLEPEAVDTLIVSHLHPDHVGMAPRLVTEWGCRVVMHRRAATLYERYNDTPGFERWLAALARRHGVPPDLQPVIANLGPRPDFMPPIGPPDVVVDDGERIDLGGGRFLEVVHTPGHEPSHICLRDSRTGILFAGDHVLGRITPVIMYDAATDDALGDYLGSLRRLLELRIGLTYPAHGTIVERGAARVSQILLHHERRLAGMEEVVSLGPATAWQVMGHVFRPHLSTMEQRLALRETVAHLEHLKIGGRLTAFDEDAVLWYRRP